MAVIEHFMLDSDYPVDKIAYTQEGDLTLSKPLWEGQYTFFNTHIKTLLYAEGDYTIEGDDSTYPMEYGVALGSAILCMVTSFMLNGECWLCIVTQNIVSSTINKKIHYRVWSYFSENDAKNADISPTANVIKSKMTFTSDENYPKFIGDGTIPSGGSYTHSLGYIPLVRTWEYNTVSIPNPAGSGNVTVTRYQQLEEAFFGPIEEIAEYDGMRIVRITDNNITTYTGGGNYEGRYYRIYSI